MTTTAYFNTTLNHPIDTVWSLIRDFNNYPAYIDGVTESHIENGKRGDEVGAIRRFNYGGTWIRQSLEAFSDSEHSFTYAGVEPFDYPPQDGVKTPSPANYEGTIQLRPTDDNFTILDWSVTLDAKPGEEDAWRSLLEMLIPMWADSLRRTLDGTR